MTLRKVLPGEPFVAPASTWNAFIDAAQDFKDRTADIGRQPVAGFRSPGIITVKNESGSARRQFDVLGLGKPIFLPSSGSSGGGSSGGADQSFRNMVAFRGLTPKEDVHEDKFVLLIEPLAANAVGKACISGVCQVRVNVTDEDHEFAEMADGKADMLESGDTGSARILWKEDGTGQKWAVVHLGAAIQQPFVIFGRIASSSQVSGYGGNRYTYQFAQVEKTGAGYGGWTDVQGGVSGTAYNLIEDQNFTFGTLGNGVSISNLTTDKARFTMRPAPTGTRVMLMPVVTTNGYTEYWFSYENGVDGGCI